MGWGWVELTCHADLLSELGVAEEDLFEAFARPVVEEGECAHVSCRRVPCAVRGITCG